MPRGSRGQCLIETAAMLPVILVLLAGLYVACRTGFLASRAHSAAQAAALRSGRGQSGIEKELAAQVLPGGTGVSVRGASGREARLLPAPFPALAGRSAGTVSLDKTWTETAAIGDFSPLALTRRSEAAVDCWGAGSRSGKNISRIIRARIAAGTIR